MTWTSLVLLPDSSTSFNACGGGWYGALMVPGTDTCVGMIVSHRLPSPCVLVCVLLTTAY